MIEEKRGRGLAVRFNVTRVDDVKIATEDQPLKRAVISGLLVKDGQRVMQPIEGTPSLRIEGRGPQR